MSLITSPNFRVGSPIKNPTHFIGRKDILRDVIKAISSTPPQHLSLRGERRVGKTSLLNCLAHPSAQSDLGLPQNHIFVYFDFQSFTKTSLLTVWRSLAEVIAAAIREKHPQRQAEAEQFKATIDRSLVDPNDFNATSAFDRALVELKPLDLQVNLLFDEFDQTIFNPDLGDPFYGQLRSLPGQTDNLCYIIATRTGLADLQPNPSKISSPFFNIFTNSTLGPFEKEDVTSLIFEYFTQVGSDPALAEKLCNESAFLYQMTGYHPFFLQMLCYHLSKGLGEPDWPNGRTRQEAMQAFEKDAEEHFKFYWEVSSTIEQDLIKKLATEQVVAWPTLDASGPVRKLQDRCLIVPVDESSKGDEWRLFSLIFSQWVKRNVLGNSQNVVVSGPKETASSVRESGSPLQASSPTITPRDRITEPANDEADHVKPTSRPGTRIFMSYDKRIEVDRSVAKDVFQALKKEYDVFASPNIKSDTATLTIRREIDEYNYLITFLSKESVHSRAIARTIETAHNLATQRGGHPVILPVLLGYREPFDHPLNTYLDPINWSYWRGPEDTPRIINELRAAISGGTLPVNERYKRILLQSQDSATPASSPASAKHINLESPEGTMDPESPFYVERPPGELIAKQEIEREGVTITIKGPRQVGKSSLLMRIVNTAKNKDKKFAFLDFQFLEKIALTNADIFFRQFCTWITDELGLEDRVEEFWEQPLGNTQRCTRYMRGHLLKALEGPLLLAMDEVDTIFDAEFRNDFFGMLRAWHNSRARPNQRIWKWLDMALVTSTEPYQFVENLHQSPFNVGTIIEMVDFTLEQVAELNRRHNSPLNPTQGQELFNLLNGHPYLVRKALYVIASGQMSPSELFSRATDERGPFGPHLRHHFTRLQHKSDLQEALKQIIETHTFPDDETFFRLRGAGLVRREKNQVLPRCQLYENYFREHLNV